MKIRLKYRILGAIAGGIAISEILLRLSLGLGAPLLSVADSETGYRFQPNQQTRRFGKLVIYNQYSQRSDPIPSEKSPEILRILMTGDSVLNGGSLSDQSQTITELFESKLKQDNHPSEVLNASAGSWGIGNQLGYLQKFGLFESDLVILQIGTHDLVQEKSPSTPVGCDPAFPTERPILAWQELISRYILPQIWARLHWNFTAHCLPIITESADTIFTNNQQRLTAIARLVSQQKTPLIVLFTPNHSDFSDPSQPPPYQPEFFEFLQQLNIPAIDAYQAWLNLPPATLKSYYRDDIHLSEEGNQAVAKLLFEKLCRNSLVPQCISVK